MEGKEVDPPGRLLLPSHEPLQFGQVGPVLVIECGIGGAKGSETAEVVQEAEMVVRLEEGLGFVLAVDIDELPRQLRKDRGDGEAATDENPVLA